MNNPFDQDPADDAFKIDFSNVQDDLIPVGEYPVECTAITADLSKAEKVKQAGLPPEKKKPDMWVWTFQICAGDFSGRKLPPLYTSLKPAALGILKRCLVALDIIDADAKGMQEISKSKIVGARALGVIQHEKYEGEQRHKLKSLKKWEGGHDDDIPY